jgi:hypothetical protein
MATQGLKNVEKFLEDTASSTVAGAITAAKDMRTSVESAIDATSSALRAEAVELSRAGGRVIGRTGKEISKHPLSYALAAVGAGLLLGGGLMAAFRRPRN